MAGEFFIFTFGPGGEPATAGDLIPLGVIEQHFRPFMARYEVTDDTDHEALLVYPVVRLNAEGVWEPDTSSRGKAVNDAEMSFKTRGDDNALIEHISFAHHPDHPAFETGIYALLTSASAVAVMPDGTVPVIGRIQTMAHVPPDLIESLGMPHLANTADELWTGPERDAFNRAWPTTAVKTPDDELNISRARQGQVVDIRRDGICIRLRHLVNEMQALLDQIRIEHPDESQIDELQDFASRIDHAATVSARPADAAWVERSSAAIQACLQFDLPGRIHSGQITNRFAEQLNRLDQLLHDCLHRDVAQVAQDLARYEALDQEARGRKLTPLSTNEPDFADMQNWPDALLAAQRKRQLSTLENQRGDVWHSLKCEAALVADWIKQLAREHPAQPTDSDMTAFHGLLVAGRKAAKDQARPDWDEAVRLAVLPIVGFAVHVRVLARLTPGPFDPQLCSVGLMLKSSLPSQLDRAIEARLQLEAMDAEIARRYASP